MDRWAGKVAIVFGASSGIGAATAEALVLAGVKVVGVGRRVERIRALAAKLKGQKSKLYPIECDVRKEEDILKVFQWVEKELNGVDILVNSAGASSAETIIEGSTEAYRNILEVNVLAVAITVREAFKSMKKRNVDGHIVIISSIVGRNAAVVAYPLSLYVPSKHAITGMVEILHNEIANVKLNIKVTNISPGLVDTDMPVSVGVAKDIIHTSISIEAKDVADSILYALATPPNVQIKELIVTPVAALPPPN